MSRPRFAARLALGCALGAALLAHVNDAEAFCRSTTCRGTCPTDADGCPSTGEKLFWPNTCVGFALQKNGTQSLDFKDVHLVMQKSFEAWTDLDCGNGKVASMTFSQLQDVPCKKSQYNPNGPNVNVVLFKDDDWTYHGIDGTLAKTSVTYDDRTGEIFDADIEVNAAFNDLTVSDTKVGYDLQSIITHEAGHFIGIAHSSHSDASMFATYNRGAVNRKLSDDDVAAVCEIYPPNRKGNCDATPRNGLSLSCDDASAKSGCAVGMGDGSPAISEGVLGVFSGAMALAIARARRRRRA